MWNLFFGDDDDIASDQETAVTKLTTVTEDNMVLSGLKSAKVVSSIGSNHAPSHQSTGIDICCPLFRFDYKLFYKRNSTVGILIMNI